MMTTLDELKAKLLANPEVKAAYDALGAKYASADAERADMHAPDENRPGLREP